MFFFKKKKIHQTFEMLLGNQRWLSFLSEGRGRGWFVIRRLTDADDSFSVERDEQRKSYGQHGGDPSNRE